MVSLPCYVVISMTREYASLSVSIKYRSEHVSFDVTCFASLPITRVYMLFPFIWLIRILQSLVSVYVDLHQTVI